MSAPKNDILMDHFMNPRNSVDMTDPSAVGEVQNPLCGDMVRLYLKIENDRIQKATFRTMGCRAAIGTSSIVTELIQGKTVAEAAEFGPEPLIQLLGELPPLKQHCLKLAEFSVKAAIGDYQLKTTGRSELRTQILKRMNDPAEWKTFSPLLDELLDESCLPPQSPL